MKIMDILVRDAVILDLAQEKKDEVLAEMAGALAGAESSLDADRLLEDQSRLIRVKQNQAPRR